MNSAFPIYVSAHPCLFKVLSINGDKQEKEKIYKISENTQFSFEKELKLEQRCPWGLEKERQQLMDMLCMYLIHNINIIYKYYLILFLFLFLFFFL